MGKLLPVVAALVIAVAACGGDDETETGVGQSGQRPTTTAAPTTTTTMATTTTTLPLEVLEVPDTSGLGLEWDEPIEADEVTGEVDVAAFNQYLIGAPTAEDPECRAPNTMLPPGSFDELDAEAAETLQETALPEAPTRTAAVFLGLEPGDDAVQVLKGPAGGPEATKVVVIRLEQDDSIRATRYELVVEMQDCQNFVTAEAETEQAEEGLEGDAEQEATGEEETQETPGGVEEEEDTQQAGESQEQATEEAEGAVAQLIPVVNSAYETRQCQPGRGHQDFTTGPCL